MVENTIAWITLILADYTESGTPNFLIANCKLPLANSNLNT